MGYFVSKTAKEIFIAALIIATGVAKPYIPNIPGIESTENYVDVSVNAEDFANQRVLILGKGNSGFEIADELIPTAASIHLASPSSIRMAWQTHFVGYLRALNDNILDTYQLKSQNAILDGEILQITKREDGRYEVLFKCAHAQREIEKLIYDRVICCTGFRMDQHPAHWMRGFEPQIFR